MSGITTHVLDTAAGRPAAGVAVTLERRAADGGWRELARARTDEDGRTGELLPGDALAGAPRESEPGFGEYRLRFEVGEYYGRRGEATFYPYVEIVFRIADPAQHYHVPLLLSPFGYTTYRGS
ncbi:MAG: hydroxyisourate hydrolase [Gemmatimonadota bacterium]